MRVGIGYDLHTLGKGSKPLVLGSVLVDADAGIEAHSNGDVVAHAIVDALLGASGLGDIGEHFPDSKDDHLDASGLSLVAETALMVRKAGYEIGNVDVVIAIERPKLAPHRDAIASSFVEAIGAPVSVKAKSGEGIAPIGTGEAVAAWAIALVEETK